MRPAGKGLVGVKLGVALSTPRWSRAWWPWQSPRSLSNTHRLHSLVQSLPFLHSFLLYVSVKQEH